MRRTYKAHKAHKAHKTHRAHKAHKTHRARKTKTYWGYHLIVNASNCDEKAIRSKENISTFVKKLVKDIDMIAYGSPRIVMFGTGNKKGYTLVQLLETSNITAHFVEETNDMYLDVFSCKSFDKRVAFKVITDFFHPKKICSSFIKRQA